MRALVKRFAPVRAVLASAVLAAAMTVAPAAFAEGAAESQAKSWGLLGEEMTRFSGKVVDILCELTGDCADNCGNGSRHLGLLREDGRLVPVYKNNQTSFNGAVADLLPLCGQTIEVDGLLVGEDVPAKFLQVQLIKPEGASEFYKANGWTEAWKRRFPEQAEGKGPWFRRDPRILEQIKEKGYLGLGPEADRPVIAEWY